jgi:hypothetical protein
VNVPDTLPQNLIAPDVYATLFPMACPKCLHTAGMPYQASTKPGATNVEMRCRDCAYEWHIELAATRPPVTGSNPHD